MNSEKETLENNENIKRLEDYENLTILKIKDKEYLILGTAHVSRQSALDVKEIIQNHNPECVCIELDEKRYQSIEDSDSYKKLNIFQILKENKVLLVFVNVMLSTYQKKIAKQIGSQVGGEMIEGINCAKENNIKFHLIDREAQTTLLRAWRLSSLKTKYKILESLFEGTSSEDKVSEIEIEKLKSSDLDNVFNEFASQLPEIKKVLIDERDEFMAKNIYNLQENRILVVIGAGHKKGLIENLSKLYEDNIQNVDVEDLKVIPKGSVLPILIGWFISFAVLGIIVAGAFSGDYASIKDKSMQWIIIKIISTALGGIVSMANPLAIIVSALVSPITSFIPTISAGMVAGVIQALIKKPTVEDLHNLSSDEGYVKLVYKNKFVKPLFVTIAVGFFSSIGTFIGLNFLIF